MPEGVIISHNPCLESVFEKYREHLGYDFEAYRGHCYRVFNLCHYLGVEEKDLLTLEVATAYHDLGIWVHHTLDYLELSLALAQAHSQEEANGLDDQLLEQMIKNHHKLTSYLSHPLVENFRKADLIDVSQHWIRWGVERAYCRSLREAFPFAGFHRRLQVLLTRRFLSHPLRPLPMMKI